VRIRGLETAWTRAKKGLRCVWTRRGGSTVCEVGLLAYEEEGVEGRSLKKEKTDCCQKGAIDQDTVCGTRR